MGAFHHPTAGFEPNRLFDGLRLFASATDVGGEAELVQGAAHLSEVVTLVQAQTLGMFWGLGMFRAWGCSGPGAGRGHRQAVQRRPSQLHVVAVGPVHCQPYGNTLGFGQQTAFDAPLTPVRGIGAGFPPPKGDLVMAQSRLSQLQSKPFSSS